MRWTFLLVFVAAPLFAQEPVRELDVWLERWQGGQKLGWEHLTIERTARGTWQSTREACAPIEGGEVRERALTSADERGLILEQRVVRTGPGGEWQSTLAAVGTGTTWSVRARQLPEVRGAVPGRVFDPDLLAWRIGAGKQERPSPTQVARLFDPVTQQVVATRIEVADAPDEVQAARVAVRLGQAIWWFGTAGTLLRHELADGPGLELVAVDAATAADMGRKREWPAAVGLSARGLRDDGLGLFLVRPGPGWELLRTPKPDGGQQLGARHPDEVTLVVDEVPLAPPEDEAARQRVGRVLTTLVEAQGKGPFRLTHPRPTRWDDGRPALEFAVSGQAGGAELRGKAWAVGGARGGLLLLAFVPADQAVRLAARLDAARKVVVLDPVSTAASPWKRVELAGIGASVEVPEEWRPASQEDPSLVAPGALIRFSATKLPSEEGTARDLAIDLVVKRTREQLGAKLLVDEPEASLGGRKGRRVVLGGFTSPTEGGLAARVDFGFVPEADGGFTLLMGVAIESPGAAALLERVIGSLRWKE